MSDKNMSEADKIIHMASWLENQKYAHELNQILGAENPKAKKQWNETNKIKAIINNLNTHER